MSIEKFAFRPTRFWNTKGKELSNHIMFQELDYISNGKQLVWDSQTLSFRGKLKANKIMELSDVKQNN